MSARARNWCFTLNNSTLADEISLQDLAEESQIKYLVYGHEVGVSGTPHIQGYCEMKDAKPLKWFKTHMPKAHMAIRRGTQQQAADYCKKDGNFMEYGEPTMNEPGKRTDIDIIRDMIKSESSMVDILEVATSYQSLRFAETALKILEPKRDWKPSVIWIWGPTGTYKSAFARKLCEEPWVSSKDLKWFDGYDRHSDVIFDDFRGDFCTFHFLLRLLDRYECMVEIKGGTRQFLAKKIVITSCYHPKNVYAKNDEDVKQLLRRIDEIIEIGDKMSIEVAKAPLPNIENILEKMVNSRNLLLTESAARAQRSGVILEQAPPDPKIINTLHTQCDIHKNINCGCHLLQRLTNEIVCTNEIDDLDL